MTVNGIRSVQTALRVLEELVTHDSIGVSQLARVLGLPKSSLQRMLYTLEDAGWVRQTGSDVTRWAATSRMLTLGHRSRGESDLRTLALPVMQHLRDTTQETVHLAVRERDDVVVLERLESPQPVRTHVALGMAVPLVASANGKAILSTWPADELQELLGRGLPVYTEATLTDPRQLLQQMDRIRARGYATNEGEWRADVVAVAAPIKEGQRAQAGLSVSTPAHRMTPSLQEKYGALLIEAAASVSAALSP